MRSCAVKSGLGRWEKRRRTGAAVANCAAALAAVVTCRWQAARSDQAAPWRKTRGASGASKASPQRSRK